MRFFKSALTSGSLQEIYTVSVPQNTPDLVTAIVEDPHFENCVSFFRNGPSIQNALVSPDFQALLFSMVRVLKPAHVIEIGTYKASTSEAIARALHANLSGILHTIDPFGKETVPPIINLWPEELRKCTAFSIENSMSLFGRLAQESWRPGIVFIDGNHDYEFALFDIISSARFIESGGYIVVDNIGQPGPALALEDFLIVNPAWLQLGKPVSAARPFLPFDRERTRIHNTDAAVIKAPSNVQIGNRPYTNGAAAFSCSSYRGLSISIEEEATGRLDVQIIFRQFAGVPTESVVSKSIAIEDSTGPRVIEIEPPAGWNPTLANSIEAWLTWHGPVPLKLTGHPSNV